MRKQRIMKIYHSIEEYAKTGYESHVALGFFDGVHLGHRAVIESAVRDKGECRAVVLTFGDSPARYLGNDVSLITDNAEKAQRIEALGADAVIFADFGRLKDTDAEDFVREVLKKKLRAKKVSCGFDYRFGKNGRGDTRLLREIGKKIGIEVEVMEPVYCGEQAVSSSAIRALLKSGRIEEADRMLGYPYRIGGVIGDGNHIGTKMGFPTVNLPMKKGMVVPRFGVYASLISVGGMRYRGATNIGVHPTVGENSEPLCETFILDFGGEVLYGKYAECTPIAFVREEMKFNSLDALTMQVKKDIETIKRILE